MHLSESYPAGLMKLHKVCSHVWRVEEAAKEGGLISKKNPSLLALEKNLLDLAAFEDVSQGVFLAVCLVTEGRDLVRFFEGGSFQGFLHTEGRKVKLLLCSFFGII